MIALFIYYKRLNKYKCKMKKKILETIIKFKNI